MFAHHATPPPPPIFSSAFRGMTTPRRPSSSSSSSTTTGFGSTVRRVSATTRRGTFEREPHTRLVLIFENAQSTNERGVVGGASFVFERVVGGVVASERRLDLSIFRSFAIFRSFTISRACLKKASRLIISQIAIGRAVKGGAISLPFMTVDVMCLSVDDVVASAPGFDRSLHRSNARREIHGRMTIDPFQTSDRSIDRNPFLPLYIIIRKGKSPIATTTGDWKKEAKNFQKTHTKN